MSMTLPNLTEWDNNRSALEQLQQLQQNSKARQFDFPEEDIDINVIATYEDADQEIFDMEVSITPINMSVDRQLTVEMDILKQVISVLEGDTDRLVKISLWYHELIDEDYKYFVDLEEYGYGFVRRTHSKYYFQPNQRDLLEQAVCEETGVASKTQPYENWIGSIKRKLCGKKRTFH